MPYTDHCCTARLVWLQQNWYLLHIHWWTPGQRILLTLAALLQLSWYLYLLLCIGLDWRCTCAPREAGVFDVWVRIIWSAGVHGWAPEGNTQCNLCRPIGRLARLTCTSRMTWSPDVHLDDLRWILGALNACYLREVHGERVWWRGGRRAYAQ